MSDTPEGSNATIVVSDGTHYNLRLQWVPRVGELIDLHSFLDQMNEKPFRHHYKVVEIVHSLYDVVEDEQFPHKGHHYLEIHVELTHHK